MKDNNSAKKYVSHGCWILEGWLASDLHLQNDVIQWIINTSPKSKPWTPERMAFEVMAIWFGSVQGLATVSISQEASNATYNVSADTAAMSRPWHSQSTASVTIKSISSPFVKR